MDLLPKIEDIKRNKKVFVTDFTETGVKVVEEDYVPTCNEGQILVKIHAAPINPLDLLKLSGKSVVPLPFTPGKILLYNIYSIKRF